MGKSDLKEEVSLSSRPRAQYHYLYGSTGNGTEAESIPEQEQESLIGEELVSTDHEGDTPNSSQRDLQHLVITTETRNKGWWGHNRDRDGSSGLGRMILIIGLALAMSTFLVILFPHTSQPLPSAQNMYIPFPSVDRMDFGDPVKAFVKIDLFHPTLLSSSEPRTFVFPFPTGAFWTNLVVHSPDGDISYPIMVYPYAYKWSDSFLQVSYPSSHRFTDSHSIRDTFAPELTFSSKEAILERHVIKFDPLSVTLRFSAAGESRWEIPLVQGSPYTTLKYFNATPTIRALSIFKSVLCPGDDDENFSDLIDDTGTRRGRKLFGVCSIDVSTVPCKFLVFCSDSVYR